jgi:hypothetical protein
MFRTSDAAGESVALNYEWSMRADPPYEIVHICGPAYASTCVSVDEEAMRVARCEQCGAQITYAALARLLRRQEGAQA